MRRIALQILFVLLSSATFPCDSLSSPSSTSRRSWMAEHLKTLSSTAIVLETCIQGPSNAHAEIEVLPSELRQYTALAPLGAVTQTPGEKLTNLPLQEIGSRLSNDLVKGANGQGGYFISGDLSPEIFRDDCTFVDPTNSVSSLSRYQNALKILFDPDASYVNLLDISVDDSQRIINARLQSSGVLQLPWRPRISPYETEIVYKIDENGLIESQIQHWSISASQALRETFTPSFLNAAHPISSTLPKPHDEPKEVTKLFDLVNGHDPDSYTQSTRFEIAALIDQIVNKQYDWHRDYLRGTWSLVYLQPGPDGGGIDRRIPFPELPFNQNYQIFTQSSVENVGELLGPLLEVRVGGSLIEMDGNSLTTPKRFQANIESGGLCLRNLSKDGSCIPLPIRGKGLFDGVYLGERLRIGQNLNGGGARVVQVKIASI